MERGKNVYLAPTAVLGHPGKKEKKELREGKFQDLAPVKLMDDVIVRDHSVIYAGVQLGDGVEVGHHVLIREGSRVGKRTVIGSGTIVEAHCVIGDDVSIQSSVFLATGTEVMDRVFLGPMVCVINDRYMDSYIQRCTISEGAKVGAGSILFPGITVGENSLVGAGSLVTRDIPENTRAYGRPAVPRP